MIGTIECPWCKQVIILDELVDASDLTEEEIRKEAAMKCKCNGATAELYVLNTNKVIDRILGKKNNGMDYALDERTIDGIREIVRMIAEGCIDSVSLTDCKGDRIDISDGGIRAKIKQVHKTQISM